MRRIVQAGLVAILFGACIVGQAQQSTVSKVEKQDRETESPPITPPVIDPTPNPPNPAPFIPDVGLALTIAGPSTASVNETITLTIQGLPALDKSKTLEENFAWAVPNSDGETILNIEISAPIDGKFKKKTSARIPLPLTSPPLYEAEVQFTAEAKGLYVVIAAWTSTSSRIAHHRILVGGDPGPGPEPKPKPEPEPTPTPEPTTDIAKYIKSLAELTVTSGTAQEKMSDAQKLAKNFDDIARRHEASSQAVAPPDAIATVDDGVKKLVMLNQAALGQRAAIWENFSVKYGEYLSQMEKDNKIDSTIFGRAKAYQETAIGLRAAWTVSRTQH